MWSRCTQVQVPNKRFKILTVIDHLKVELFVAVYFNEMLHCYDKTQLQH